MLIHSISAVEPINNLSAENLWLTIAIILFALSLISERLGNFIKLNIQTIPFFEKYLGNFRFKEKDQQCEKLRERGVMWLAMISGITVAIAMNADLIYLFKNGEFPEEYFGNGTSIIGYLATGFFISLGSKFWHDLLDLLLYASNIKRNIAKTTASGADSADEIKEILELTDGELVKKAYEQNLEELKKKFFNADIGIETVWREKKKVRGIVIHDYSGKSVNYSSNQLHFTSPNGRLYSVPLVVIQTDKPVPQITLIAGSGLRNSMRKGVGTFGCLVKDIESGEKFILSCYHVLKSNTHYWNSFLPRNEETILDNKGNTIGRLVRGYRDLNLDFGLVKPDVNIECLDQTLNQLILPNGYRKVDEGDGYIETPVFFKTEKDYKKGKIINHSVSVTLDYSLGGQQSENDWTLYNLMRISERINGEWKAPSIGGDSGSIVYDSNNKAVGMIVGGSSQFSYAIPIDYLFTNLRLHPATSI